MIATHPFGGRFQRLALFGGNTIQCRLQLIMPHHQLIHAGHVTAVKAVGVFHQRRIAAFGHITKNTAHPIRHFLVPLFGPGGKGGQLGIEIRVFGVKPGGFHGWHRCQSHNLLGGSN